MTILSTFTLSPDDLRKEARVIGITDPARVCSSPCNPLQDRALTSADLGVMQSTPRGAEVGRFFGEHQ